MVILETVRIKPTDIARTTYLFDVPDNSIVFVHYQNLFCLLFNVQ